MQQEWGLKLSQCASNPVSMGVGTECVKQSNSFPFKRNYFLLDEVQIQPQIPVSLQRRRKEGNAKHAPHPPSLSVLQLMSRTIPAHPGIPSLPSLLVAGTALALYPCSVTLAVSPSWSPGRALGLWAGSGVLEQVPGELWELLWSFTPPEATQSTGTWPCPRWCGCHWQGCTCHL